MKTSARNMLFFTITALAVSACSNTAMWGSRSNPVDTDATNYQGYQTVTSSASIVWENPASESMLDSSNIFVVSAVTGATNYEIKIGTDPSTLDSSPVFDGNTFTSNSLNLTAAPLSISTRYYWKARAKLANGWDTSWSPVSSFLSNNYEYSGAVSSGKLTLSYNSINLLAGKSATVSLSLSDYYITSTSTGSVIWFDSASGTSTVNAPTGITTFVPAITNYKGVITFTEDSTSVAGTYYFRVTIDNTASSVATLKILASGYTITFNANGGSGSMPNQVIASGQSATLVSNTFTAPTGYTFVGWTNSISGAGTSYADQSTYATGNVDTTLYAIWLSNSYYFSSSGNTISITRIYSVSGALTIPNGITTIGPSAFSYTSISSISLPPSITSIASYAFSGCSNLTAIYEQAISPPTLSTPQGSFSNTGLIIYVPVASLAAYYSASGWSSYNSHIQGN